MPHKEGVTYEETTACGKLYVTCNDKDGRLVQVFFRLGKAGGCAAAFMRALGILVSIALKNGLNPADIFKSFKGSSCHKGMCCIDAAAHAIEQHEDEKLKPKLES